MFGPFPKILNGKNIEEEMDQILGITPFQNIKDETFEMNDKVDSVGKTTETRNNNPLKAQTLETDNRSDINFGGESMNFTKSKHHNFQKHTVTALKDIVNENEFQSMCENVESLEATKVLWTQFNKNKSKKLLTKKFLSILFRCDLQSVTNLKEYGFKEIFEKFSLEQIQECKNELRLIVIKLFSNKTIKDHVDRRSIQRKEEFQLYLINFREELKSSSIKKRISKESSDWIYANAQMNDWIL